MTIEVNNEKKQIQDSTTLAQLANELSLPQAGVAVARNQALVPRAEWESTILSANDKLLIIQATQGG